ncbi:MAG: hypothetical protein JSS14_14770 [Proteobacteria bacterium]|nr:hypothetical protein [Pseudomonadota bacterium]
MSKLGLRRTRPGRRLRKDFATRYPSTPAAVLDEIGKVHAWSGTHREELAALAAEATGIDLKSWNAAFARASFPFGPVTDARIAQ